MAKENIVSCGKKNPSAMEIELEGEIVSLKRQLGGLKTSNANYRKQVEKLKVLVEHYKHLDIEGDELYENKIAECDDLRQQLEEARKVANNVVPKEKYDELEQSNERKQQYVEQLQERVQELSVIKAGLESEIVSKNAIIDEMDAEIVRLEKPWWRKIFG